MRRAYLFTTLFLSLFLANACADEAKVKCNEGDKYCDDNGSAVVCTNGTEIALPCAGSCEGGECKAVSCTAGELATCVDDQVARVCEQGTWIIKVCDTNLKCISGQCVSEQPVEQCDKNFLPSCKDDSTRLICSNDIVVSAPCNRDEICVKGECVIQESCRSLGSVRCVELNIQTCDGAYWHITETCKESCKNGKCVDKLLEGASCSNNGEVQCKDSSTTLTCTNNIVVAKTCLSDELCVSGLCQKSISNENCVTPFANTCVDESTLKHCVDGKVALKACSTNEKCEINACVTKNICQINETRCNGKDIQICIGTAWQRVSTCPNECVDSMCTGLPNEGESCDATFPTGCKDQSTQLACVQNIVKATPCANGEICKLGNCVKPKEGDTCTSNYQASCEDLESALICEGGVVTKKACDDTKICKNGVCLLPDIGDPCTSAYQASCKDISTSISCVNGAVVQTNCTGVQSCKDGVCAESNIGDACTSSYIASCHDLSTKLTCVNNLVSPTPCNVSETCKNGICSIPAIGEACAPNYVATCDGLSAAMTCDNGIVKKVECPSSQICKAGLCAIPTLGEACTSGYLASCENLTTTLSCVSGIVKTTNCQTSEICKDGSCVVPSLGDSCTSGYQASCANLTTLVSCVAGTVKSTTCAANQVCKNNACVAAAVGDNCTTSYPNSCLNTNTLLSCVGGKVQSNACAANQVCKNNACVAAAVGDSCTSAYPSSCQSSTSTLSCVAGKVTVTNCAPNNVCNAGVCSPTSTGPKVGDPCTETSNEACDGSQVLYCDTTTSKYVAGTCTSNELCRTITLPNNFIYATCTVSCSGYNEGDYIVPASPCLNNMIKPYYCLQSNEGDLVGFPLSVNSICRDETTKLSCNVNTLVTETCAACTESGTSANCSSTPIPSVGDPCTANSNDYCSGTTALYCDTESFKYASAACESCNTITDNDGRIYSNCSYPEYCVGKASGESVFFTNSCEISQGNIAYIYCLTSNEGPVVGYFLQSPELCFDPTTKLYCSGTVLSEETCVSCTELAGGTATCTK